jgi:hypothetical protein
MNCTAGDTAWEYKSWAPLGCTSPLHIEEKRKKRSGTLTTRNERLYSVLLNGTAA